MKGAFRMEQKTIGKFITALRKANGMTQKDLAEKCNVSDKTISRWERDEGSPDLAMIPVLAEIFDVTCDELLRGERKPPEQRTETENTSTPKGEKQRQRMLKSAYSQFQTRTYIAMGVSVIGMIAALIGNLAFLKAVLGFLIGAVFFAASIVCQAIFLNHAFLSVEDAGLEDVELSAFKRKVIRLTEYSIGLTVAFIGFTFPLIMMDAYLGLSADNMLLFGSIGTTAFLLVYAVVLWFLNAYLLKKEVYLLGEEENAVYQHNHKLQKICAVSLCAVLALTFLAHQMATTIWGPASIMKGTTFHDYESFIAFMEQDIPPESRYEPADSFAEAPAAEEQIGETIYYDEDGNEITEEQWRHRTLEDINGNVVCEYIKRNESIVSMRYSPKDGTVLPITVSTYQQLKEAEETAAVRHVIFAAIYVLEVLLTLLIYFRKRAR